MRMHKLKVPGWKKGLNAVRLQGIRIVPGSPMLPCTVESRMGYSRTTLDAAAGKCAVLVAALYSGSL